MSAELKIGDSAPDFCELAVGGKFGAGREVSLKDFRGSWLVLYFYPKDDTPGCTKQACGLRDAWDELNGRAQIFGVSVDSAASHQEFIGKHQLPFPLLSDPGRDMVQAYGVWVEKVCSLENIWASSEAPS
jgi:peroxiredoxin Q/BCP